MENEDTLYQIPENWCDGAKDYWKNQEASVNGMLGGFDYLAEMDVKGSKKFINSLLPVLPGRDLVLDVGAGIGRVSKTLLLHFFNQVSLLECTESFLAKARESIEPERLHSTFQVTMQEFQADPQDYGKYDMIWIQWVIIYASDDGLVAFLKECAKLLKEGGLICIKDNIILPKISKFRNTNQEMDDILLDGEDCSITRSERYLYELTKAAGLELRSREQQAKFPKEIFPVVMYAFGRIE